jgi:transposase
MKVTLIGIDLAKAVFQVCGVNQAGKPVFHKQVRRERLLALLAEYPDAIIAMEACSGSNFWGRTLEARGFAVRLIPPKHVKPFVKGNKNDRNDAFAICEAAARPNISFVKPRSLEQTDLMLVHRVRERLIGERMRLVNQVRGYLKEYGIVLPAGDASVRRALPVLIEDADSGLTPLARLSFRALLDEWRALEARIGEADREIKTRWQQSEAAQRLSQIRGVAEITSTAVVAFAGNARHFRSGRHFAAVLGLVPKEHSSGGKQRLGSISKRGNGYLRRLLVQCAWSIIRYADRSQDRLSIWVRALIARRGKHIAAIAVANKLARIIWAMLSRDEAFRVA